MKTNRARDNEVNVSSRAQIGEAVSRYSILLSNFGQLRYL